MSFGAKAKFSDKIKKAALSLKGIFTDYPVTLGAVVLAAFLGAIIIDVDFDTEIIERIIVFLLCFAGETLLVEEFFARKVKLRIIGYAVAIFPAVFYTYVLEIFDSKAETFLGMDVDKAMEVIGNWYIVFYAVLAALTILHICKRLGCSFEKYCLSSFFAIMKTTLVYGIFAGGLAILVLIFDELIMDTGEFLSRIELFLAGGIYVPAMLLAVTDKRGEIGKFARGVVLLVFEPLLMAALVIIYIYIVKIFVTSDVPSNSVFSIITFLFVAGLIIWTLVIGLEDRNSKLAVIGGYLPFVFIPCIFLQIWSLAIRIGEYGYTVSRYVGVILIIFELIYMILFTVRKVFKKDLVAYILIAAAALAFVGLIMPGVNSNDVIIRSQLKRLEGLDIDKMFNSQKISDEARSICRVLKYDCGYKGKKALESMYTEEQLNEIFEGSYEDVYRYNININVDGYPVDIDISGFSKMTMVTGTHLNNATLDDASIKEYLLNVDDVDGFASVNMKPVITKLIEEYENSADSNYWYIDADDVEPIDVGDGSYLVIYDLTLGYNTKTEEINNFYCRAILLTK
ncbi:MAG: DUF4153 domain-containing protein [Lachnospiraceae bacterium]|nr:DUF4153 domain-containing protein [Lachnospiraceae bacterium]